MPEPEPGPRETLGSAIMSPLIRKRLDWPIVLNIFEGKLTVRDAITYMALGSVSANDLLYHWDAANSTHLWAANPYPKSELVQRLLQGGEIDPEVYASALRIVRDLVISRMNESSKVSLWRMQTQSSQSNEHMVNALCTLDCEVTSIYAASELDLSRMVFNELTSRIFRITEENGTYKCR